MLYDTVNSEIAIISPHIDDALLSMASYLSLVRYSKKVHILNVFSKSCYTRFGKGSISQVTHLRKREDCNAFRESNNMRYYLDFPDWFTVMQYDLERNIEMIEDDIINLLSKINPDYIFMPSATNCDDPDHILINSFTNRIKILKPIFWYLDQPYSSKLQYFIKSKTCYSYNIKVLNDPFYKKTHLRNYITQLSITEIDKILEFDLINKFELYREI